MDFIVFVFAISIFRLSLLKLCQSRPKYSALDILSVIFIYGCGLSAITYYFAADTAYAWIYVAIGALISSASEPTVIQKSSQVTTRAKRELGCISLLTFSISTYCLFALLNYSF